MKEKFISNISNGYAKAGAIAIVTIIGAGAVVYPFRVQLGGAMNKLRRVFRIKREEKTN